MNMFPRRTEQDVSELLAVHFNAISNEFRPLNWNTDIPTTKSVPLPVLQVHEVAARLPKFKKPRSMVRGDIFPDLVTKHADLLAVPLTAIYNDISATLTWPKIWKEESVTIIPKVNNPSEVGQLRNISCTMLAPVADYCDVVYHSLLTDERDKLLDNLQNHALRLIYGTGITRTTPHHNSETAQDRALQPSRSQM